MHRAPLPRSYPLMKRGFFLRSYITNFPKTKNDKRRPYPRALAVREQRSLGVGGVDWYHRPRCVPSLRGKI